ncbi:MAG: hypothetical protein GXO29_05765 [Thermotogae bacterium]|nr:hypothetical protein [Thermotogota bacterium]
MGFVFWYLGNGAEYTVEPKSLGMFHREHFVGFRQEEITITTDRLVLNLKGGYITGIERTDDYGRVVGDYDATFTGLNVIYMNAPLTSWGWTFGVGPGVLLSKIYDATDYAITLNAMVMGRLESGEVLVSIQNVGYGSTLPTPELYIRGITYNQNFKFGPFVRLFGDRDLDGGFIFKMDLSPLEMRVSPSLRNTLAGMSLEVGPLEFSYDYEYYWIGYSTHRIGLVVSWGRQRALEEQLREHERRLKEHERRIAYQEREIKRLKTKISALENKAREYAQNLVKQAEATEDPEEALRKLEIAYAFDTTLNVEGKIEALRERIARRKKTAGIRRVETLLKNGLYSDALAEALLLVEEFPDDPDVLKIYRRVKRRVEASRNSRTISKKAESKYVKGKLERAEELIRKGKYVEAARIVATLPAGPDKVRLLKRLQKASDVFVEKAKYYIEREEWARAKYYLEKALKIYPNPEATSLLSYVESRIKKSAHLHYIRALELYQKGDIVGAFAHIKEAYLLDPKNERYRGVYYRLKNALEEK